MRMQPPIEARYTEMPEDELARRIAECKERLGSQLCILGHHYQRDSVLRFADFTGDSLKLSQRSAETAAKFIVFCGVHFMAESADILRHEGQVVILPDLSAGCSMAEMADAEDVEDALRLIERVCDEANVIPVTYVNSTADVKALTGRWGGACCTSSNARKMFDWALRSEDQGGAGADKILALPDEHLARNTAFAMGYQGSDCVVYDPRKTDGGLSKEAIRKARFILWKGHCYVHQKFTVEQVDAVRVQTPGIRIIVHPECSQAVVQAADESGSTEQIIRAVSASAPLSKWAIGTEVNMVRRLAANNPDKFVRVLSDAPPLCAMMDRIDPPHLLWVLEELCHDKVVNRISVPPAIAADAKVALERMLEQSGT